ncbi:MAG: response regulator transcription factor [Alphaproteobacteria bacterium]|nr:response regulator transcription factor [Alphaproteobacteria bacterium]
MKILIADDHELFLDGLTFALSAAFSNIEVVKAHDYIDLLNLLETTSKIDLILTDLAMPGKTWNEALCEMKQKFPNIPVIIISAAYDRETVLGAIDLGAGGFIPKTSSNKIIIQAIQLVLAGGIYLPKELIQNKEGNQPDLHFKEEKSWGRILSRRQREVLHLMTEGKTNKAIARELDLTEGTVKLHATAIFRALNVLNRTEAVLKAKELIEQT